MRVWGSKTLVTYGFARANRGSDRANRVPGGPKWSRRRRPEEIGRSESGALKCCRKPEGFTNPSRIHAAHAYS